MMATMESVVELRDADICSGQDGAEIGGLSVLSGQLLSATEMEPANAGLIMLAAKIARHAGTKEMGEEPPVAGRDEISVQTTLFIRILARVLSWLPPMFSGFIVRKSILGRKLSVLDGLLPPAPVHLAAAPTVTAQEHVILNLPYEKGQECNLTARGTLQVKMEIHCRSTRDALRRHLRKIPSKPRASAGYLLLWRRPTLEWPPQAASSALGRPIGKHVVSLEDLTCDHGFADLKEDAVSGQAINGVTMPLQIELGYKLPSLLASEAEFRNLFVIAAGVPGEDEVRHLDFTITLRPDLQDLRLPELYPATMAISLPREYPPVDQATVIITENTKPRRLAVRVATPEHGSGVSITTNGNIAITPGNSIIVSLVFRKEGPGGALSSDGQKPGIVGRGGRASLALGFTYDQPFNGIEHCILVPRSGRLNKVSQPIKILPESLRFDVNCDLSLDGLKFPSVRREPLEQSAGQAAGVDVAFVKKLISRLAGDRVLVRQALQGQSSGYKEDGKIDVSWDLYARYEESMAGPDVHIAIRSDTSRGSSLAKFEVTVLGRVVSQGQEEHLRKVRERVGLALKDVVSTDIGDSSSNGYTYSSETYVSEEASEPNSLVEGSRTGRQLENSVEKLEALILRLENLLRRAEGHQGSTP